MTRESMRLRLTCTAVLLAALAASAALAGLGILGAAGAAARAHRPARPAPCLLPGRGKPLGRLWRPHMSAAIRYARHRQGDIAFAVRTSQAFYGYRPDHQEWSASVLKAMLLVAYLNRPDVARRPLNAYEKGLLDPMITRSDNGPANTLDVLIGNGGLQSLAARVGMRHFTATAPIWGESEITARDQTKFFLHIKRDIARLHRAYAMRLLAGIVPSERWGIGQVAPRGWRLYFKGGWGAGTGLIDNQVALLTRGCVRVSIAVLTMDDGSHDYGKQTLAQIFHALLRGLPTGPRTRYR